MASRTQPKAGCRHCVSCSRFSSWGQARLQREGQCDYNTLPELWPAGLASPTVFYMVRERQLNYQIHAAAQQPHALWRLQLVPPPPAPLLRRRRLPTLEVRIPLTATGVDLADSVVYLRSVEVTCRGRTSPVASSWPAATAAFPMPHPLAALPPAPPLAVPTVWAPVARPVSAPMAAPVSVRYAGPASVPVQRLATPPKFCEQPAKRTRVDLPAYAASYPRSLVTPSTDGSMQLTSSGSAAAPSRLPLLLPCAAAPATAPLASLPSLPSLLPPVTASCSAEHVATASCASTGSCASTSSSWAAVRPHMQQQDQAAWQDQPTKRQTGSDDPHGVLAWLRKIHRMLDNPTAQVSVHA